MHKVPLKEVYLDGYIDWPDDFRPGNFCYITIADWPDKYRGTVELSWCPEENVVVFEYRNDSIHGIAAFPCGTIKMMVLKVEVPSPPATVPAPPPALEEVTRPDIKSIPPAKTHKKRGS